MMTPDMSLSTTVAVTSRMVIVLYLTSLEVAVWVMVARRLPSWSRASSTAMKVTVWAVFQLDVVKRNVAGFTMATFVSSEVNAICTLAAGRLASFTV